MKQKLLFFLFALICSIGAWAETINLGNSGSFKANANTTFYKNGTVQGSGVWCDKATQGCIMLTGSISSSDGKIEVVKYGATSLTISVPSNLTITGYSFGLKIAQNGPNTCSVNGTELNESSATTISASNLSTSSVTINFTGTGDNNGECRLEFSDFTIEVSGTFISDASQLSNTKAYVVTTGRGTWTLNTANTIFSSTKKNDNGTYVDYDQADMSSEAQEFAIYKSGDYYYLYSLKAGKFIAFTLSNQGASLYDYATVPYTVSTSSYSPYPLRIATFDSRNYTNNNGAGGIAINGWTTEDDGNRLAIAEARDLTAAEQTAIANALAASPLLNRHKAFTVTANRGTWCANSGGTSLATTTSNSSYATDYDKFALMFLSNKFYLYNLGTKKFIKKDGSLNADGGDEVFVRYSGDTNRPYMFFFTDGNIYFNMQGGGGSYVMNTYSTPDDGNKQSVTQADAVYIGEMLKKFESMNDITDGDYHITTIQNGVKYYVTPEGKLSKSVADGGTFAISKTEGGDFGTGIRINYNDSKRFTNPGLSNNRANLSQNYYSTTTTQDRDTYERQVFFKNDEGKFAIRSCNVNSANSSWGDAARTFWTYNIGEARLTPCLSYDPAYVWELEAPGTEVSVTFNLYYGGNKVHEVSATMEDGAAALIPSASDYDFCSYTYSPATITTGVTSVDVTVDWTGPFELSADYATAHWYDMSVRGNWYVTSDQADGNGALETVEANAMGLAEDAYQWAFVGDPWHVRLFNKDKGSSLVYAWTSTANESVPAFVDASSSTNYWWIRKSQASGDAYTNAFQLTIPEYGYQVNQFGGAGGSLKIWADPRLTDVGSAFNVFNVPNDFHEFAAAEIQPYATPTGYFALKDDLKSSIGWDDSYATNCPFATYKAMKLALLDIDLTDMSNYNLPETGYYRFKSKMYDTYMGVETAKVLDNYSGGGASTIVKLTKGTGDNAGKYTIALQGRYLQTLTQSADAPLTDDAASAEWFAPTVVETGYGIFGDADASASDGYSYLHAAGSNGGNKVVGWVANAEASKWEIEDADDFDLTISSAGYSTLWVPFAVTIPSGVEVYTGTITPSGDYLHLNKVTGSTLPASTAVVLKGEADTYNFDIAADVTAIEGNALLGSNGNVTGNATSIYALAQKDGVVGFYCVDSGITVPANKAYLNTDAGIKGFIFVFDDMEDGIGEMKNEKLKMNNDVFDLSGRKVNGQLLKGVYIVNGRKVLF